MFSHRLSSGVVRGSMSMASLCVDPAMAWLLVVNGSPPAPADVAGTREPRRRARALPVTVSTVGIRRRWGKSTRGQVRLVTPARAAADGGCGPCGHRPGRGGAPRRFTGNRRSPTSRMGTLSTSSRSSSTSGPTRPICGTCAKARTVTCFPRPDRHHFPACCSGCSRVVLRRGYSRRLHACVVADSQVSAATGSRLLWASSALLTCADAELASHRCYLLS